MDRVLSIIMGGGKGTRLYPLTKERAKPAVPFGGKYRLVDIPISNSINSGFLKIYVLTQFLSASLHVHVSSTYLFDSFSKGFVQLLAAEQGFDDTGWYQGTADAVRKNLHHFRGQQPSHYLILSGDQLYRMDLEDFYRQHVASGAEISIAATPVDRSQAVAFGILKVDETGKTLEFVEKPPIETDISSLRIPGHLHPDKKQLGAGKEYLASMGIYCFNADTLERALDSDSADFGKEIIPQLIAETDVHAYVFTGFWEDIGTIRSFYETNINLAAIAPDFNFYEETRPIYSHRRDLPASKFNFCSLSQSLAADGCIITNASINNSIIGIRTIIDSGANLDGVVCMGADYYETPDTIAANAKKGIPSIGIGRGCMVRQAIIDKNARIGEGCRIGVDAIPRDDGDYESYSINEGIIVIHKNGVIAPNTVI
jgi:glucose-1-phosphate adenylyltransferase